MRFDLNRYKKAQISYPSFLGFIINQKLIVVHDTKDA